jgi:hypothetical protein
MHKAERLIDQLPGPKEPRPNRESDEVEKAERTRFWWCLVALVVASILQGMGMPKALVYLRATP